MSAKFEGLDNYGKPRKDYLSKLKKLNDDDLKKECEQLIWLSSYAGNNPRSDYHWQCDACYLEATSRNKVEIYNLAFKAVAG